MTELWTHQRQFLDYIKDKNHCLLAWDLGTGKTRTTIETLKQKYKQNGRNLKTVIFAPSIVLFNWAAEINKFWPEMQQKHVLVLHGSGVERQRQLERTPNYFIVIVNYETLLMDGVFSALRNWFPDVVVCDESHRVKNHKAQRTKRLLVLTHTAKYKFLLSGTPVTNNQLDLFSQFLALDNGETFGRSFFGFRNQWFTDKNARIRQFSPAVKWPQWEAKAAKADEFREKVMSKAVSVTKAECLDLPSYTQISIEVGMAKDQEKAYKEMKEDFITFSQSKAFSVDLAVTKALRLLQITSGYLMNTEGDVHYFKNTPKDKAVLELIEDASGKLIVWVPWRASQAHVADLLGTNKINYRMLTGDQDAKRKDEAVRDFTDKREVKVLIASTAAASVGINLIAANQAIYYSRTFSFEHDYQSAARIHRGGQTQKVTRFDLVVPNTIDQSCMEALTKKEDLANSIINSHLIV